MIRHYFVCANTSRGFINYFDSNLKNLKKVYILKGGPGTGKSTLMKKIGYTFERMDYEVEFIHCSSDVESLDGVVVRKIGFAIVDGTAPHVIEPTAPGALEEYVHLGIAWDLEKLEENTSKILEIQENIKECYKNVYQAFENAIKVHDDWEKCYITEMNFEKADLLAERMSQTIIGDAKTDYQGEEVHRFFGATTPTGPVDYINNLTQEMQTRYFIKGRSGTGKSSMLKKIAKYAVNQGYAIEIYHCAFDPNSLDMVIIPELKTCIFDSTAPHEYFPSKANDHIVDVYEECVNPGTDEKYADELSVIQDRYNAYIKRAKENLRKAKAYHDELEKFYIEATDFTKINEIRKNLYDRILKLKK